MVQISNGKVLIKVIDKDGDSFILSCDRLRPNPFELESWNSDEESDFAITLQESDVLELVKGLNSLFNAR